MLSYLFMLPWLRNLRTGILNIIKFTRGGYSEHLVCVLLLWLWRSAFSGSLDYLKKQNIIQAEPIGVDQVIPWNFPRKQHPSMLSSPWIKYSVLILVWKLCPALVTIPPNWRPSLLSASGPSPNPDYLVPPTSTGYRPTIGTVVSGYPLELGGKSPYLW